MNRRAWMLMAVLAATWGASYLFIKVGLRDLDAAQIVFSRTALAALVLLPFALRSGGWALLAERKGSLVVIATIQVIAPFLLISLGQSHVASALAGILVASAPIFTALLAVRFAHNEAVSGWGAVGVGVGIAGIVLLFGVDIGGDGTALLAGVGILVAGLGYAAGGLLVKSRMAGVPPAAVATSTMGISAVATLPLALLHPPASLGLDAAASVLALGALGTGVAFLIYYTLIAELGASRASLVAYLAPGFAVAYGALLLDERITAATIGGLALILLGSWMGAEGRPPWRLGRAHRVSPVPEPACEDALSVAGRPAAPSRAA